MAKRYRPICLMDDEKWIERKEQKRTSNQIRDQNSWIIVPFVCQVLTEPSVPMPWTIQPQ